MIGYFSAKQFDVSIHDVIRSYCIYEKPDGSLCICTEVNEGKHFSLWDDVFSHGEVTKAVVSMMTPKNVESHLPIDKLNAAWYTIATFLAKETKSES